MKLNPQQQAIVDWTQVGSGSAIVVARAGCGKTFALVRGVVRTIVEQDLGEVALMAFNKSAADEFKARLGSLADETGDKRFLEWKRVQTGTVHSFGFGAVRRWSPKVRVDEHKVHGICDTFADGDTRSVYSRESTPIRALVSLAKQSGFGFCVSINHTGAWFDLATHHAVNDMSDGGTLDEIVPAAQAVLRRSIELDREAVDFDDMILAPLVHNLRMWPKDWVLIDEAQDTNACRRALALKLLKPRTGRLVAVGDDRQAIYGFTGADADSLELIRREVNATILPLTVTYRCPKAVVAEANRLVPDLEAHETAPEGIVRSLAWSRPVDPDGVIHWFTDENTGPEDAVLCRNTKPLVELAHSMLAAGIGCRVEGREIGEGMVRLATRWKRVVTLTALGSKLEEYRDREIQKWQAKGREDRAQAVDDKVAALLTISGALVDAGKTDVKDLVAWIRDLFGDTRPGEIPNVVTLSTIHKAKGREWDRVYLIHRTSTLPSPWARKPWQQHQEENLEYVAITRAKRELIYVD